jgi:hypothetical protein
LLASQVAPPCGLANMARQRTWAGMGYGRTRAVALRLCVERSRNSRWSMKGAVSRRPAAGSSTVIRGRTVRSVPRASSTAEIGVTGENFVYAVTVIQAGKGSCASGTLNRFEIHDLAHAVTKSRTNLFRVSSLAFPAASDQPPMVQSALTPQQNDDKEDQPRFRNVAVADGVCIDASPASTRSPR